MGRNTDTWDFYKKVDFSDEKIKQFHVDTRDFHVYCNADPWTKDLNLSTLVKYPERFFHTAEEVSALIDRYFKESGGPKTWRFFYLKGMDGWDMKYIRVYRTGHGLVVCNGQSRATNKEKLGAPVGEDRWAKK